MQKRSGLDKATCILGGIVIDIHIIHGWTYNLDRWKKITVFLKEKGFNPIFHNVPGLTVESDKAWNLDEYVEWFHGEIGDEDNPIVLAHSNGGRISLGYCLKYPGSIRHLFLIGSAGITDTRMKTRAKRLIFPVLSKVLKPISKIPLARKVVYRLLGSGDYNNANTNMKLTMQNMLGSDRGLKIENVKTPATLIWGENDTYVPPADGKRMEGRLQKVVSWNLISNAGHSPHDTHSNQVLQIITRDLKDNNANI